MTILERIGAGPVDRALLAVIRGGVCGICLAGLCLVSVGSAIAQGGGGFAAAGGTQARDEVTAQRLHEMAQSELVIGRSDVAQRLLEQLVARFPDAEVATQARRDLYAIYAGDRQIAGGNAGVAPAKSAEPPQFEPAVGQPAVPRSGDPSVDRAGGWRTSLFARATLQDEWRSAIGDRVFFSAGSSEIGSRARAMLTAQAVWLSRNPDVEAVVEGHADVAAAGQASGERVDGLARGRAEQVRFKLLAEGVEPDRLRVVSLGASEPVATCGESDCAAQNRRVVVRIELRGRVGTDLGARLVVPAAPAAPQVPN